MRRISLLFPLSITLFFLLFSSALFPSIPFSPLPIFLALLYHRYSLEWSLLLSFGCGFILDLFSSEQRLGTQAAALTLTAFVLYRQKQHFFADKPLSLALFVLPISCIWTAMQWVVIPLSGIAFSFSFFLVLTDLIIMPIVDAAYGYFFLCLPLFFYEKITRLGWQETILQIQNSHPWITKWLPKKWQKPLIQEATL